MRRPLLAPTRHSVLALALKVLLLELLLGVLPSAAQTPELPTDSRGLLKLIQREKDGAPYQAFRQLALIGTPEAFEASTKATESVKRGPAVGYAYNAFQSYRQVEELQDRAIEFLSGRAREHRRDEHQLAATRSLAGFGPPAHAELELLVRKHRDDAVRKAAITPIIELLLKRDTEDSVTLVLELAEPRNSQQAKPIERGLHHVKSAATVELLVKKLGDRSTSSEWKPILIDHLGRVESEAATDLLLEMLEHEDPNLAVRAVEALASRREEAAEKPLWKLLKSPDPTLKRAAIVALGNLMGGNDKWVRRLFDLSEDKDPVARMGATVALAELRTQPAVERLHALLADGDRRVRIEAVQQVGNLRRKDSIPELIERLLDERGRIAKDIVSVLRLVTGLDNGTSHARWNAWWNGENERFEVPPYEEALAAEQARRERREENVTLSSFYGLNVVSDRVCFVLDHSGSMTAKAREEPGRTSTGEGSGPTRIDVAKRELSKALQHYPEGDLFNVVFFESTVRSWSEELVEMKEKPREEALAFVQSKRAGGGTNVHGALLEAFSDERIDTIYLLTDGGPSAGAITDPARLRTEIARLNAVRKVQINCISVGQASALLRGLAADSGGEYREVGMGR
jgi:HEAT repeat protein